MIIERNTQGLLLLSHQRFDEAARTFRSCLVDLHTILATASPEQNKTRTTRKSFYDIGPLDLAESCTSESQILPYTKGFFLQPNYEDDLGSTHVYHDEHLLSAVFLYNLALTFHIRAQVYANPRQLNSKKAMSLYKMVVNFLRAMSFADRETSRLLQLAVFNNMAQIHMERYEIPAFVEKVSWMQDIVCSDIPREEEVSFFALNLVLAEGTKCFHFAPAA